MDGWETFTKVRVPRDPDKAIVTIAKTGSITINLKAFECLGYPKRVIYQYNPSLKAIAIQKVAEDDLNNRNFNVSKTTHGNQFTISATSFLRHIGHETQQSQRFEAKQDGPGRLVFELGNSI